MKMQDKLYHGTVLSSARAIMSLGINTEINIGNELDFGYGFYLGDKVYARKIAMEKAQGSPNSVPVVMEYYVDFTGIKTKFSDGLIFRPERKVLLTWCLIADFTKVKNT